MKSTRLSGQNSSDLTKKRPPSGALPYIAREGFSGTPSRPRPLSRGKPYTRRRGKAVFCRRAAPGPAAPGTPLPRRRPRPRQARRPGKAPPCGPERPHVRPRRRRPGKRPAPGKRPTLARKRRRFRRRKHSAVCAAPRPGKARTAGSTAGPGPRHPPRPGSVPRRPRAARQAPPAHTHPAGPAKAARLARPAGCTPRGVSIPGRDRLETAAPSHAEKATIKQGINPARKGW